MAKINISEFAAESAESIVNGNLSHVVDMQPTRNPSCSQST